MAQDSYKAPYMPWYERDFWSPKVRRLPRLARLMLRSLLQQGWHSDNPPYIPADDEQLMDSADAPSRAAWQKYGPAILSSLTKTDDGKWYYHHKALGLYATASSLHQKKRSGAQKTNQNRSRDAVREGSARTAAGQCPHSEWTATAQRPDIHNSTIDKHEDTDGNQSHDQIQNHDQNKNDDSHTGTQTDPSREAPNSNSRPRSDDRLVTFLAIWNENCGVLPKVSKLTDKRAARLKTLCRKPTFAQEFAEGVRKAANTPFLRGESDRGWKANFDWLIQDDTNLAKVVEGAYDDARKRSGNGISADRSLDKYTTGLPRAVVACSEEEESS